MNWIKKAPTGVLIAVIALAGVVSVAFLAGFVVLELDGKDTTEYRGLVNLVMNAATVVLAGIGAIGSASAARSSSNAEEQTNGTLTSRDQKIAELEHEVKSLRRTVAGGS